ncbi:hypothetical protein [Draconibacterium halophilum]|uniref:Uncharacterized protein n=1 Tax=Draconibacterium halophilum TaxID=2706887 RepID=A0A6C0R922_9BACT|nr:hypothetical protein [Draconibacterium halophilum]QIA06432.1 hypothetical protein G0Q07_01220 [Draconibacterium halophilum]
MNEIEFHKKRIELTRGIIAGYKKDKELAILDSQRKGKRADTYFEQLLEFKIAIDKRIAMCSEDFKESEVFLNARGINPYPMTTEEKKQFKKEYPDPYRWRWPAWLREPIKKLFTKNKGDSTAAL